MLWWIGFGLVVFFALAFQARLRESPQASAQVAGAVVRLGNVVYWAAVAIAIVFLGIAISSEATQSHPDHFAVSAAAVFAVVLFIVARGCRYVLRGR